MGFAVTARLESIETTTPEPPNHRAIGNAFLLKGDPAVHLIEDCGVFAVGYLMRPIGSLVLGPIGDLARRKAILLTSVVVMAA
jgi:MFS family permease